MQVSYWCTENTSIASRLGVIALVEIFFGHEQEIEKFQKPDKSRDSCPEEQEVQDAKSILPQIKLMGSKPSQKEAQEQGGQFAFHLLILSLPGGWASSK